MIKFKMPGKLTNVQFYKSNVKNKKYKVYFRYKEGWHTVNFGDNRYEHYKDQTPLKLYKHLDHLNTERRRLYRSRAAGIRDGDGNLTYMNPLSANYWSYWYLW